jgi:hypothetical protein
VATLLRYVFKIVVWVIIAGFALTLIIAILDAFCWPMTYDVAWERIVEWWHTGKWAPRIDCTYEDEGEEARTVERMLNHKSRKKWGKRN